MTTVKPVLTNNVTIKDVLTSKEELFCLKYIELDSNGTQSALAAYNTTDKVTAASIAYELLRKPQIIERINELRKPRAEAVYLTLEERKRILAEHAKARLVDFIDETGSPVLTKDTPNNRAASEYETMTRYNRKGQPYTVKRIKLRDPISAISEYNKMEGIGRDNQTNVYINKVDVSLVRSKVADLLEGYSKDRAIDSTCKELEAPPAPDAAPDDAGMEG